MDIQEKRAKIEHHRERVPSLDDIGHRLRLHRVYQPQQGGDKGDKACIPDSKAEGWKPQGEPDQPEYQAGIDNMDDDVDDMVAGNLFTAEVVTQRKGDKGNGPGRLHRCGCFLQSGPAQFVELDILIDDDVLDIVEVKRDVEAVGIDRCSQYGEQDRGKPWQDALGGKGARSQGISSPSQSFTETAGEQAGRRWPEHRPATGDHSLSLNSLILRRV